MTAHHRTKEWAAAVRKARPIIRASLPAPCIQPRCQLGGIVHAGQRFDVGHIIDAHRGGTDDLWNLGPAHPRCNRSDGGKAGRAMQTKTTTSSTERWEPKW